MCFIVFMHCMCVFLSSLGSWGLAFTWLIGYNNLILEYVSCNSTKLSLLNFLEMYRDMLFRNSHIIFLRGLSLLLFLFDIRKMFFSVISAKAEAPPPK